MKAPNCLHFLNYVYFSRKGRISRIDYFWDLLVGAVIFPLIILIPFSLFLSQFGLNDVEGWVILCFKLIAAVCAINLGIKRSHDIGLSGWFTFINIIPFGGLILLFRKGTIGPNKYGPDPLEKNK